MVPVNALQQVTGLLADGARRRWPTRTGNTTKYVSDEIRDEIVRDAKKYGEEIRVRAKKYGRKIRRKIRGEKYVSGLTNEKEPKLSGRSDIFSATN